MMIYTTTTLLRPFFPDHPGEPVPEENFWTLWRKAKLTEADTPTIRLGATPSGLSSAHLHHPPMNAILTIYTVSKKFTALAYDLPPTNKPAVCCILFIVCAD